MGHWSGRVPAARLSTLLACVTLMTGTAFGQTMQPSTVRLRQTLSRSGSVPQERVKNLEAELAAWKEAIAVFKEAPDTLKALLVNAARNPPIFIAWAAVDETRKIGTIDLPNTTVGGLVSHALLTRNRAALLEHVESTKDRDCVAILRLADALEPIIAAILEPYEFAPSVAVSLGGNIKGTSSGSDSKGSNANGLLMMTVAHRTTSWTVSMNLASTADTMKSGYSQLVLSPSTGKALAAGLVDFSWRPNPDKPFGLHAYATASQSIWKNGDPKTSPADTLNSIQATVWGVGALFAGDVAIGHVKGEPVGLGLEAGVTYRVIGGDAARSGDFLKRAGVLGVDRHSFLGLELGAQATYKNTVGALQAYYFGGTTVRGVTGVQLVVGFSIYAPILNGKVGEPASGKN